MIITAVSENKESRTRFNEALKVIAYFSVFDYPLLISEILKLIPLKSSELEIAELLNEEVVNGVLISDGTFFGIGESSQFNKRKAGNILFDKDWKKSQRFIKTISRAPYVRGILVTGSMSKGFNYIKGDVDYFVITEPERLWICRTFLVLYKKLFLFNSRKYFCVNYFISARKPEIEDKNIFTAVELATAIPVYNSKTTDAFFAANVWIKDYLSSDKKLVEFKALEEAHERGKKSIEFLFNHKLGNSIDTFCKYIHIKFWKWKFRKRPHSEIRINIQNTKDVSKFHPGSFREKVLKAYEQKLHDLQITKP